MNLDLSFFDTDSILTKALKGERPFPDEAIYLCAEGEPAAMAAAADRVARHHHPEGKVGYAVSKTVIYSNICQPRCPFCTGTVTKDHPDGFTRSAEQVVAEVEEAVAAGATQIFLQGGHRIDLEWAYYPGLVRAIHERFPDLQIFAYSPTEIMVFNAAYQKRTTDVIQELKEAGMGGLFAGGAERLQTRGPEYRALLRGPWNEWFDVVHRAVDAGLPVVVPFVFGLGESARERVGHLYRVRAVQERTQAMKRPAFAAMAVFTLPDGRPAADGETPPPVSSREYLRMVALARVLLPNIRHIQASPATQGAKVAQEALSSGADDLGQIHLEGAFSPEEAERLIQEAGGIPLRRQRW
ncbi:MAG: radical SAM protein [Bacillota bacterium]